MKLLKWAELSPLHAHSYVEVCPPGPKTHMVIKLIGATHLGPIQCRPCPHKGRESELTWNRMDAGEDREDHRSPGQEGSHPPAQDPAEEEPGL